MGNSNSSQPAKKGSGRGNNSDEGEYKFRAFSKQYETLGMVQDGLRKAGLEASRLMLGIDYTISNTDAGKRTFGGLSLHYLSDDPSLMNPYQQVISTLGRTLDSFSDNKIIPTFGFGSRDTKDQSVFSVSGRPDGLNNGVEQVLESYRVITPTIALGGPTSFAPIINRAIEIVKADRAYYILVIIADGELTPDTEFCNATTQSMRAVVEASKYPISIIIVGVGDGPWDQMRHFDNDLPQRRFDNINFVDFDREWVGDTIEAKDTSFAIAALQEIPEQYTAIRKLGYI